MATANGSRQRTFLGHPIGLYVLFFTEMWERFSYYGMRALLILYMVNYFKWAQKDASSVYKWYTSLVYVTPILGGYLADRVLGNRLAVIIGAALMAVGHFLMAFEEYPIFFTALMVLILGNGFFKPNMSTQVGRLYPTNDPRRDGAYTIFYMGINLGAFLSPLACGWLADNTLGSYHSGFTLAGVGMFIGLATYLLGQKALVEIDPKIVYEGPAATKKVEAGEKPLTEDQAERTPSILGAATTAVIGLLTIGGIVLLAYAGYEAIAQRQAFASAAGALKVSQSLVPVLLSSGTLFICAWVMSRVHNAVRDRVLSIVILGVFVVFFWAAFEQAGNALNLWADKHTDRYITRPMKDVSIYPEVVEAPTENADEDTGRPGLLTRFKTMFVLKPSPPPKPEDANKSLVQRFSDGVGDFFNPLSTTSFQSINALAIFVLAPLFAWLWLRVKLSIPMKMTLGLLLQAASLGVMMQAARSENGAADVILSGGTLPKGVSATADGHLAGKDDDGKTEVYNAGRLTYDAKTGMLHLTGVLPDNERDRIVRDTTPESYRKQLVDLQKELAAQAEQREKLPKEERAKKPLSASIDVGPEVKDLDLRYSGLPSKQASYDASTRRLTIRQELADKDVKSLQVSGGDPALRSGLDTLMVKSGAFRVSSWWLFWSYILATLGELCLSPVGLSMVSKLAPAKFATMLMGLWLLTSAFGNFAAGAMGEFWGTVPPVQYFAYLALALTIAAVVLFVLVRKIVSMMHGVS